MYFTPSSLAVTSIISEPLTFSFALSVPGSASKPACTIAEFALLAPIATSFSFSRMQSLSLYADSVLKSMPPMTPPPIMATSYMIVFPPSPRIILYKQQFLRKIVFL